MVRRQQRSCINILDITEQACFAHESFSGEKPDKKSHAEHEITGDEPELCCNEHDKEPHRHGGKGMVGASSACNALKENGEQQCADDYSPLVGEFAFERAEDEACCSEGGDECEGDAAYCFAQQVEPICVVQRAQVVSAQPKCQCRDQRDEQSARSQPNREVNSPFVADGESIFIRVFAAVCHDKYG